MVCLDGFNFYMAITDWSVVTGVPAGKHIGAAAAAAAASGDSANGYILLTVFPKKLTFVAGDVIELPLIN